MLDQSRNGAHACAIQDKASDISMKEYQLEDKENRKKQSNFSTLRRGMTTESNEGPSSLAIVDNVFSDKIEHNSDLSGTFAPKSMESTIIGRNVPEENPKKNPRSSNPKKLSAILDHKQKHKIEFDCEKIKQNHMNHSNFGNVICLQFLDEDKRQSSDPSPKESKNAASIWVAKFSPDNKLLATGGSNGKLRIYSVTILDGSIKKSRDGAPDFNILSPESIELEGHKNDITDLSWYKDSRLILTSSMDRSVILWDVVSRKILQSFEHPDIVSCVSFSPLVDGFYASGCFDKIIRVWDMNEIKVKDWIQTNDIITALTFSPDKNYLLVGFVKGVVKIYKTDKGKLRFSMEITCKNAFSWGKLNKFGKKVTGIVFTEDYEFLVMTNDSRMRLIDFKTFETKVKYKGHSSGKYHIQPSYNNEKEMILCGSEDGKVYAWNKESDYVPQINPAYTRQKKNRNTSYEYFKPFPKANTTCAIWLPFPLLKKYKENVLSVWKDMYIDNLMILFSSDSRIKILGNVIEL